MKLARTQFAAAALVVYAVTTLIGMAPMSFGAAFLGLALLAGPGGPQRVWKDLEAQTSEKWVRVYWIIALAVFLTCLLSLFGTVIAPVGYNGERLEVHWLEDAGKLWYLFWPPVLLLAIRRAGEAGRARALRAWIVTAAVLFVVGIVQYYTGWPRPQGIPALPGPPRFHATLFLGHHLSVASILIFPYFAMLQLARSPDFARYVGLPRALGIVGAVLGGLMLFFTHSKTLWVGLPIGVAVWSVLALPRRWGVLISAVAVVALVIGSLSPAVRSRFADPFSFATRAEIWSANVEFFRRRPVLGIGWRKEHELSWQYAREKHPRGYQFGGHAHNSALSALSTTGIVGLSAWLAWCVFACALLFPLREGVGTFRAGLLSAWIVFQINGLTQLNFWEGKVTHIVMLMMAWALAWKTAKPQSARKAAR